MEVKRTYVCIWYINVKGVPVGSIPEHIERAKQSISKEYDDPWKELSEALDAKVVGYFIPTIEKHTQLEIKEFSFQ